MNPNQGYVFGEIGSSQGRSLGSPGAFSEIWKRLANVDPFPNSSPNHCTDDNGHTGNQMDPLGTLGEADLTQNHSDSNDSSLAGPSSRLHVSTLQHVDVEEVNEADPDSELIWDEKASGEPGTESQNDAETSDVGGDSENENSGFPDVETAQLAYTFMEDCVKELSGIFGRGMDGIFGLDTDLNTCLSHLGDISAAIEEDKAEFMKTQPWS